MLPPMIYKAINPSLAGLDTENAYLEICRLVLPPGLLGLMLTGMYFSTSASANTALNVVSAVFTNDIYKGIMNPMATDRQLIRVARLSSWGFGLGMIAIALLVPYVGGIVEVVLSIGAVTGGPLLAPAIWALFSKRQTGRTTLWITCSTLSLNLLFKLVLPVVSGFKLSRAEEMVMGMGVPILLLAVAEWLASRQTTVSADYLRYLQDKADTPVISSEEAATEAVETKRQNRVGLKVIAGALAFTALMLLGLSLLTAKGAGVTALIAIFILGGAAFSWFAALRIQVRSEPTPLNQEFIHP
jgi:Na+/proline symporter